METKKREPRQKLYEEEIIEVKRVTKVTKGGRHFRFSATMAVGDRKGHVGIGTGKANEVPDAMKKAVLKFQSLTRELFHMKLLVYKVLVRLC